MIGQSGYVMRQTIAAQVFLLNDEQIDSEAFGDFPDYGIFDIDRVGRGFVAVGPGRRADGAEADGLDAVFDEEVKELGLLAFASAAACTAESYAQSRLRSCL